ncbi:glutamate-ammonia-ligase adenylyltransferase [Desulfurobacterium atlanticum]|uniref:Glutamate-ammonia-ligase adenylyltransferase n=1 Tax=Desulfurobacterium atlanticum TaxID=240169 RepID=A0A238XTJ2_9BACT|nr:glutamate-ammonia-ligase adenylyltransferase [Desulfurobacterium atlanticum]SNR61773.1 glutamate-ammonia-ligase adenylyltransferase [Desulfurobacterium atlanticum]
MKYLLPRLRNEYSDRWQKVLDIVESEPLPNPKRALIFIDKLKTKLEHKFPDFFLDEAFLVDLIYLFSYSQFLGDFFVKYPEEIEKLASIYRKKLCRKDFLLSFPESMDETNFKKLIRFHHRLHMARIVLRDIRKLDSLLYLTRDVTLLHDAILDASLRFATGVMEKRYGKPEGSGFCIVDMGKAAGFELNYSSDLDVIYVYYSRYGRTTGGSYGSLDNHDYFSLFSEYITKLITENTKEGKCFELDLRLRPNGTMGPICNDIEALEEYYTAVARPWERFALLKSRPSAGDLKTTGIEFVKLITPFVYRKYIDFTLIEEVLRLKELIKAKVSKKLSKIDVKLGEGGIREIEFIVQAFQIIFGGKNPHIRSRNTLIALEKLRHWGFLTESEYRVLKESYLFLRRTEHMIQITNFRQTQTFHPDSEEAEELAKKLGFETKEKFLSYLKEIMSAVHQMFERFFPTEKKKTLSSLTVEDLKKKEFFEPEEIKRFIDYLFNGKLLSAEAQNRLDIMGETFIDLIFEMPDSRECMKNLITFLEKEEGKIYFLSYLKEINTLKVILMLLSMKEFFIKRFLKNPEILEYIFDPEGIERERSIEIISKTFDLIKNDNLAKDLEEVRAVLRYLLGRSDVKTLNRELTNVADVVINRVYKDLKPPFLVASLGKHGSREMNIGSDIDILFIFCDEKDKESYMNLIVDFIEKLKCFDYEVDTRLRPFGEKGELGFTVNYMESYFKESARVWERLAYTRFRVVAGNDDFKKLVNLKVKKFLFEENLDEKTLREILKMRERLEKELSKKSKLKYSVGGIVDSEFIAYTYQLLRKKWIGNVYDVLHEIARENARFSELPELFIHLREAEVEKRFYGKFISCENKLSDIMEKNRKLYLEFFEWIRPLVNTNGK